MKNVNDQLNKLCEEKCFIILDDDSTYIHELADCLSCEGWAVVKTNSPNKAKEIIRQHEANALIMDVVTPHCDGLEFFAEIREGLDERDLPIIFVTGLVDNNMARELNHGNKGHAFICSRECNPQEAASAAQEFLFSDDEGTGIH
jgi:CheY-like chemotaxis protein